jgi:serine protease Do
VCANGGNGGNNSASTRASSAPVVTGPSADWLGMQIVTTAEGVVIDALRPGSPADQAGLEPGDQIQEVDNHQINSVMQLRSDTAGVKLGAPITIGVLRSSVMVQGASIPMTQRPTIHQ